MARVIRPLELAHLPGPFQVKIVVRGEDTAGVMAVIEETVPPRTLISPHTHANDVWVQVLTGTIGVLVDDEVAEAGAGDWALKPRNVLHAMWNSADEPARIIELLTPAGSERWFEKLAGLVAEDTAGFEEACERHGIAFFPESPWIDVLRQRFGLAGR